MVTKTALDLMRAWPIGAGNGFPPHKGQFDSDGPLDLPLTHGAMLRLVDGAGRFDSGGGSIAFLAQWVRAAAWYVAGVGSIPTEGSNVPLSLGAKTVSYAVQVGSIPTSGSIASLAQWSESLLGM